MTRIHTGLSAKNFQLYSSLVKQAAYCTQSGLLATDHCASKATGWYSARNMPGHCVGCGVPEDETNPDVVVEPANPTDPATAKPPETTAAPPATEPAPTEPVTQAPPPETQPAPDPEGGG